MDQLTDVDILDYLEADAMPSNDPRVQRIQLLRRKGMTTEQITDLFRREMTQRKKRVNRAG